MSEPESGTPSLPMNSPETLPRDPELEQSSPQETPNTQPEKRPLTAELPRGHKLPRQILPVASTLATSTLAASTLATSTAGAVTSAVVTSRAATPGTTTLEQHRIYAFAPNRDTLGGTAYLIVEEVKVLIDCPSWDQTTQSWLEDLGGVDWLVITHRGGMGKVKEIQQALGCQVLVQEQEAYLLPGVTTTTFRQERSLSPHTHLFWSPGHSPGSSCLYFAGFGGILFSGRHLLPTPGGQLQPICSSTTFHWPRQVRNVQQLLTRFSPDQLALVCPGANTGFLHRQAGITDAYAQLSQLDFTELLRQSR